MQVLNHRFSGAGPSRAAAQSGRADGTRPMRARAIAAIASLAVAGSAIGTAALAQGRGGAEQRGQLVASGGGSAGAGHACFACHGVDGMGDAGAAFPRLAGLDALYLRKQLEDYAGSSRPNPVMSPIAKALSAEDRKAVSLYYASLEPAMASRPQQQALPVNVEDSRLLQRGATLYAIGSAERGIQGCVNCHGPAGEGLNFAFPAVWGQPAGYVVEQLRLWREGVRRNDQAEMMRSIAVRLSDEDMKALGQYLRGLRP